MNNNKTGKFFDQIGGSSRAKIEAARNENDLDGIIKSGERRLLRTLFVVLGACYVLLLLVGLEKTWYAIGILVVWIAFALAILVRKFVD